MTKQKQIEEITKTACIACAPHACCPLTAEFRPCGAALEYAKAVYDAGYRNADDVRKETAKVIMIWASIRKHSNVVKYLT